MEHEKRWFQRYPARQGISVVLQGENRRKTHGQLIDVSYAGAYIHEVMTNDNNADVCFEFRNQSSNERQQIKRKCHILSGRSGLSGGCAIKFDNALTPHELAELSNIMHYTDSLELTREDYRLVNDEVSGIQACRTQMFIGSIGVISAWLMGSIGIGITNHLQSPIWMAIGSSFPYFLLTIAILGTIEKSNAVNMRRGFLAVLADYLRCNVAPPNYVGWAHLKLNRAECRSRFTNNLCPFKGKACWERAASEAENLTKKHHLVSNVLDSFNAFVCLVYGVLYLAASILIFSVCYNIVPKYSSTSFFFLFVFILGVSISIVSFFLYHQVKLLRKGKKSPEAYYCEWHAIVRNCRSLEGTEPCRPPEKATFVEKDAQDNISEEGDVSLKKTPDVLQELSDTIRH